MEELDVYEACAAVVEVAPDLASRCRSWLEKASDTQVA